MSTKAEIYLERQTAQRLILTVCDDLDKMIAYARTQGDPAISMTTDKAESMAYVLEKARGRLIGI